VKTVKKKRFQKQGSLIVQDGLELVDKLAAIIQILEEML